jgi:hypothetical protein
VKAHEEGDENRCVHQEKRHKRRPSVTQSIGDGTSEEDTNECTALSSLEERRLPLSRDGVLHDSSGIEANLNAVSFFEPGQSDEVAAQKPARSKSQ